MTSCIENVAARILIVEDEAILAEDLGLSLENLGYVVRGKVSTGEEAVELAEKLRPDLILMDIKLQGDIDGIEAAGQIRKSMDIPVVFLTGYSETDVLERAKRTEPYGYLGKPISVGELRNTIETALYRHAADRKVRESEEKYRLLFSKEKDAIALTDACSQIFIDVNESFEGLYGYTREEIIGMPATMVSAEPQSTRASLQTATQPEGIVVPLRWHKTKHGKVFPVEIAANAFTLQGRQVVSSIIRDITEREKAEEAIRAVKNELEQLVLGRTKELMASNEALRESQSTLRLITDSLPVLISYVDSQQRYRFCNKTYELWRGVSRGEIEGRYLQEILGEEAYEKARPYVESALSGHPVDYEMGATYPDGKEKHLNVIYVPDTDEGGVTKGFAGLVTDITERKKMEEALRNSRDELEERVAQRTRDMVIANEELKREIGCRTKIEEALEESEEKYRLLHETMMDAFVSMDMRGRILETNRAYQDMLGYSEGELRKLTYVDLTPERWHALEARLVQEQILVQGYSEVYCKEYQKKDGTVFPVELRTFLIRDKEGNPSVMWAIVRNITERKKAERDLLEREELIRSISDNLPSGMIYQVTGQSDGSRRFTYLSRKVRDFYGCSPEEATADAGLIYGRIHPEDRQRVFMEEEKALESLSNFRTEVRMIDPSGGVRWSYFASSPKRLEDGSTYWSGLEIDITERKRAEEALRESEQRFRSLIEQASDALFVHDLEGKFLEVNQQAGSSLSYTRDELLSMSVSDIDPDIENRGDKAKYWANLPATFEARHRRKDGTTFPVEIRLSPIEYGQTKVVLGVARDITDRKMLEEALRESEELYRSVVNLLPDGILVQLDGEIAVANPALAKMVRVTSSTDLLGRKPVEFVHADNKDLIEQRITTLLSGKPVDYLEQKIVAQDGAVLDVEVAAVPIVLKGKRGYQAVVRDITQRKRWENSLRESEQRFTTLVESMNEGVGIQDNRRIITYVNDRLCESWGYTRQELVGRPLYEFLDEDNRAILRSQMDTRETGMSDRYEITWTGKGGRKIHTLMSPRPLHDNEGNFIGSFAVLTDLTSWKKAQEELEVSLREKEVLLREIHHRVKNNLAVIQSLLRIQSHHVQNQELSRILEETQHRVRSMSLCHELLYQSDNLSEIRISQYLGNLLNHLRASFSTVGRKIEIKYEIEEFQSGIDQAVPLGFVLTELITNCYQHAFPERRNGQIEVSLRCLEGERLQLVVKDDGIGLPEGIDVESPKSLGYHLIGIFVKQLRGKMEFVRQDGTEVRISFPLK